MAAVSPFGHLPAAPICGYWRTSELLPELVRRVPILVYLSAANRDMKIAACRDGWSVVSRLTNDLEHGSIFRGKTVPRAMLAGDSKSPRILAAVVDLSSGLRVANIKVKQSPVSVAAPKRP